MSLADVRATVRFYLHDPDVYAFTDAEIDEFLSLEKVPDSMGRHPMQTNYVDTWDALRAAGRGWMWLSGLASNKALSYKAGDVAVTVDKNYCLDRARELMGGKSYTATRRDEPWQELHREKYYDGDDPRHRS